MFFVLLGFMVASWVFTLLGTSYVLWHYVYKPWQVVRKDVAALNAKILELEGAMGDVVNTRKMEFMTDEELASVERRMRERSFARSR